MNDKDAYYRALVKPLFLYALKELSMNGKDIGREVERVKRESPEEVARFAQGALDNVESQSWHDFLYELTAIRYVIHLREASLQGTEDRQPVTYSELEEHFSVIRDDGKCIHEVDGGCWMCQKRAS